MSTVLPRVLILGPQFDSFSGSGITLSSIFGAWPRENLSILASSPETKESLDRAQSFHYVGQRERWRWPFSWGGTKSRSVYGKKAHDTNGERGSYKRYGRVRRYVIPFVETKSWRLERNVLRNIAEFSPQVVYAQVSSAATSRFAYKVVKEIGVPVAVHQMDDWLWSSRMRSSREMYVGRSAEREFRRLVGISRARLAISDGMAREYQERYGGTWEVFHNGVEINSWVMDDKQADGDKKQFVLRYGGRVSWGIGGTLTLCAKAVEVLRKTGVNIRLDIHSPDRHNSVCNQLARIPGVSILDPVRIEELRNSMLAASCQLIAYDFDQGTKGRAGLSMPTKVSEYLAARRPITIVGPAELSLCREAECGGWAHVVSKPSIADIAEGLRRIVNDEAYRSGVVRRAWEECKRSHDLREIRKHFSLVMSRCAEMQ